MSGDWYVVYDTGAGRTGYVAQPADDIVDAVKKARLAMNEGYKHVTIGQTRTVAPDEPEADCAEEDAGYDAGYNDALQAAEALCDRLVESACRAAEKHTKPIDVDRADFSAAALRTARHEIAAMKRRPESRGLKEVYEDTCRVYRGDEPATTFREFYKTAGHGDWNFNVSNSYGCPIDIMRRLNALADYLDLLAARQK